MCQMCLSMLHAADLSSPCELQANQTEASDSNTAVVTNLANSNVDQVEFNDALANASTTYSMGVDERFEGEISSGADVDWIEISLEAGEDYVFQVFGTGGYWNGIDDTALTLYDNNGNQLAFSDDMDGWNEFSLIEFTATTSGTYFLAVSSGDGSDNGDFILETATNEFSVEQVVTQMTEFGWGARSTLQHEENTGDTMQVHIANLTADGQQLALWALESWGEVMGMSFEVVSSQGDADIRFDDNQNGAFAGPSSYNPVNGNINYASVNVGTSWIDRYGTTYDSYSYLTYLHEIGHALGLMHSGNYNGSANWGQDNHYINDSYQMTVMSYFGINEAGLGDRALAITPMIADVAAVWSLYGAPAEVNVGNTVWGANSNVSGTLGTVLGYLFDGDTVDPSIYGGGRVAFTITDTDGIDTLDLSTVSADQVINLFEEGVSDINGRDGNMVVSQGTVVENYIGGTGRDTVTGSGANNNFKGGDGNDTISGEGGADLLYGQDGDDEVWGGSGNDSIYSGKGTDVIYGGSGNDYVRVGGGVENFYGGSGSDWISYYDSSNGITADLGENSVSGSWAVNDTINSFENISGSKTGNDRITGSDDDNTIMTYGGNDRVWSEKGKDKIILGDGDDYVRVGGGEESFYGGDGHDYISYYDSSNGIRIDLRDDEVSGSWAVNDIISDFESASGSKSGNDRMLGTADDNTFRSYGGDDFLWGRGGSDTLYGGDGEDFLDGGIGEETDYLYGGADADTFHFDFGEGRDVIKDFEDNIDTLELDNFEDFLSGGSNDPFDYASQVGSNVVFDFGSGGHVTIENVTLAQLQNDLELI